MQNGLEALFGSKSRVAILKSLFNDSGSGLRINEIVRDSKVNPRLVSTEVKKLEEIGIVRPNTNGSVTRYSIDLTSFLYSPLKEIFYKKQWYSWERPARIHHLLITMEAQFAPMNDYYGVHFPIGHLIFEKDNVTWFYQMQEFIDAGEKLVPIYKKNKKKIWRDFHTYAESITNHKSYKSFYENYVNFWKVAYVTELVSFYIDSKLSADEHIAIPKPSFTDEYEDRLWELAEEAQRVGVDTIDVVPVVSEYSWIRNSYHSVHTLTEDEVRTEVRKKMGKKRPQQNEIAAPTSITPELLAVGQDMVLMQDLRKKYMMIAAQYLNDLLTDIGSQYGLSIDLMNQTLPSEVLTIKDLSVLERELNMRLAACSITGSYEEGIQVTSGKIVMPDGYSQNVRETLTGRVACGGKAIGRAKVIRRAEDIHKVNHGDVIVSPMTDPMMTPAIRRSVAIVTDEGGITCHAAVIAREFNLPCIIATGDATSRIKDKDLVVVDGDSGVVRILSE